MVEPLRIVVTTKPKDTAVKQQVERNEELVRSALRVVALINRIPNMDANAKWFEFIKTTVVCTLRYSLFLSPKPNLGVRL